MAAVVVVCESRCPEEVLAVASSMVAMLRSVCMGAGEWLKFSVHAEGAGREPYGPRADRRSRAESGSRGRGLTCRKAFNIFASSVTTCIRNIPTHILPFSSSTRAARAPRLTVVLYYLRPVEHCQLRASARK